MSTHGPRSPENSPEGWITRRLGKTTLWKVEIGCGLPEGVRHDREGAGRMLPTHPNGKGKGKGECGGRGKAQTQL